MVDLLANVNDSLFRFLSYLEAPSELTNSNLAKYMASKITITFDQKRC